MSWREQLSPGFLSEYRSDMSWTKGVGAQERRAKQPMEDVERALKHRRISCRSWSSRCSSLRSRNVSCENRPIVAG